MPNSTNKGKKVCFDPILLRSTPKTNKLRSLFSKNTTIISGFLVKSVGARKVGREDSLIQNDYWWPHFNGNDKNRWETLKLMKSLGPKNQVLVIKEEKIVSTAYNFAGECLWEGRRRNKFGGNWMNCHEI